MIAKIDKIDRAILNALQNDASLSVDDVSQRVNLSRNACWRRIKVMEDAGVIKARVALVNPASVGVPLTAMVLIRTNKHDEMWMKDFQSALQAFPEVVGAYRMTGDLDYLIEAWLENMDDYDQFYQTLTSRVTLSDVSASFVMESLKNTTELPVIK